jgi:hypothetical protein
MAAQEAGSRCGSTTALAAAALQCSAPTNFHQAATLQRSCQHLTVTLRSSAVARRQQLTAFPPTAIGDVGRLPAAAATFTASTKRSVRAWLATPGILFVAGCFARQSDITYAAAPAASVCPVIKLQIMAAFKQQVQQLFAPVGGTSALAVTISACIACGHVQRSACAPQHPPQCTGSRGTNERLCYA